jgi:hypothetical protein
MKFYSPLTVIHIYVLNLYINVGYSVLQQILYPTGLLNLVMDSWK